MRGLLCIEWLGFLDQHNWDIVADLIEKSAAIANQSVLRAVQVNIALALRARQYFQQFRFNGHFMLRWGFTMAAVAYCSRRLIALLVLIDNCL